MDETIRKILDLPRSQLTEERLRLILEKHDKMIRLELKKKTILFLVQCHNLEISMSEAVVRINNSADGQ
jgi:hypothetical protein